MESFGELDPSNQTGISAKSCRLKSAADNPFKNTSAEVPLYIDCLCIPDVIPALHDNHVGSTCSCLNQKPNEIDWIFSAFSISKCIFFLPPHFDLPLLSLISDLKVWGLGKSYQEVIIRVALETSLDLKSLSLSYIQIILTIHARTNEVCLHFPNLLE